MNVTQPNVSFNGLIKLSSGKVVREEAIDGTMKNWDGNWELLTKRIAGAGSGQGSYGFESTYMLLSDAEYQELLPKLDIKG